MSSSITTGNSSFSSTLSFPHNHSLEVNSLTQEIVTDNKTNSLTSLSLSTNSLTSKKNSLQEKLSKLAYKIGCFLQQNWHIILLYILIWTTIIVCYGAMYGFETVGLPLAIGLGVGFGIGIISGIVVALKIDKKNKWAGKNTLWSLVTHYMWELDEYGTRQILIATIITVVSAAFTASPYAIGGIIGLLLGNHILTKICYHLREIPSPLSIEEQQTLEKEKSDQIEKLQNQLKIELLVQNQMRLKQQLMNIKHKKSNSTKKLISSSPINKKGNFKKKRVKKRIIFTKNKLTNAKNRQLLLLQHQIKQSANKIDFIKSHLLEIDDTINIKDLTNSLKI